MEIGRPHRIVRLAEAQIRSASGVLARAFQQDPLFASAIPEATRRARWLPRLLRAVVRYGCLYGEAYATAALDGVAVWLSPGNTTMRLGRMFRAGMLTAPLWLGRTGLKRFSDLFAHTEALHRRHAPGAHWYLFSLGVDPAQQGKGVGGALILPVLSRADAEGLPCYLETQTERNVRFYEKHGFRVVEEGTAPGRALPIWAMRRKAGR